MDYSESRNFCRFAAGHCSARIPPGSLSALTRRVWSGTEARNGNHPCYQQALSSSQVAALSRENFARLSLAVPLWLAAVGTDSVLPPEIHTRLAKVITASSLIEAETVP